MSAARTVLHVRALLGADRAHDLVAAIEMTLAVLRHPEDGVEEGELTWFDADDEGVWPVGENGLGPSSDLALYQAIPLMPAFEDR